MYKSLGLMPQCRLTSVSKNDHYLRKEPFCSLVYFSFCLNGSFAEGRDDLEGERPKQELTEISIRRWNRCHWFKNSPIRFFADFYPFSKVVFFFKSQGNALRPLPSVEKKILFCFFSFGASAPVFRSRHEEHDSNGSNYTNLRIPLTLSPNKPSLIRA